MKRWNAAKAKRKLDKLWSTYIRQRDKVCTFCRSSYGKLDANHIMSRRHTATRWDVRNGNALCFTCHRRYHDDPAWGAYMAKGLIGKDLFRSLFSEAHTIKPFDRAFYAAKLIELQRLNGEISHAR